MSDALLRLHGNQARRPVELPERPRWLVRRIESADLSAGTWALCSALLAATPMIAVMAGLVWSPAIGVASAVGLALVPIVMIVHRQGRRDRQLVAGLPDRLDLIARALRTGHSLRNGIALAGDDATGSSGPSSALFRNLDEAIERGLPVRRALLQVGETTASPDLAAAVVLLSMVADGAHGGASAIEAGSGAIRQRSVVREEVRALIAQAETSLRVVAALPFVFVGLGVLSGQSGALALFTTPIGRLCLVVGITLEAIGMMWMTVLVNRALQ